MYCLDRKDMFYQVKSSDARRDSNVIAGPIPVRDIMSSGLSEFVGDEIKDAYAHDPLLKASGCLAALGQGDHLACEFVQKGPLAGLSAEGAISETTNLDARQIYPAGDLMTGVVLDDIFAVQTLPTQRASASDLLPDLPLQDGGKPVATAAIHAMGQSSGMHARI